MNFEEGGSIKLNVSRGARNFFLAFFSLPIWPILGALIYSGMNGDGFQKNGWWLSLAIAIGVFVFMILSFSHNWIIVNKDGITYKRGRFKKPISMPWKGIKKVKLGIFLDEDESPVQLRIAGESFDIRIAAKWFSSRDLETVVEAIRINAPHASLELALKSIFKLK